MKLKMAAILAGTVLAITSALPASATVVNTNGQYLTNARNDSRRVVVEPLTPRLEGIIIAQERNRSRDNNRAGRRS